MIRKPFRAAVVAVLVAVAPVAARQPGSSTTPPPPCPTPCVPPPMPPTPMSHADVEVNGRAVRVSVGGLSLSGEADRATLGGVQGCLVLEGNVHLTWGQDGHNGRIAAEHVVVHLKDGRVEVGPTAAWQGISTNALQSCFSFWPSACH